MIRRGCPWPGPPGVVSARVHKTIRDGGLDNGFMAYSSGARHGRQPMRGAPEASVPGLIAITLKLVKVHGRPVTESLARLR